ncbi:MAG: sirohydrochlorin cobaltochelatase [Deltaproteobacteria bacterium]|nr:sirohydrochlorin cobaltochelatase [Deltaproteobacteria bacterium]
MILALFSFVFLFVAAATLDLMSPGTASAFERKPQKPAIVLAGFGTTDVGGLQSILNIQKKVTEAFPDYDIHLAFTSNIIRDIWHQRASDQEFRKANPSVPDYIYDIKNALTVLADIQENGARLVLVQSLHVTDGEEYTDLAKLVEALANYKTVKDVLKPFPWIGVGEPALGVGDGQPKYIARAVEALKPLAEAAKVENANLVLMGHGNEILTQKVYGHLLEGLRKAYGPHIYLGTVEAPPHAPEILEEINKVQDAPKVIYLAPLMVVAGDHAHNDMAGDEPDSWKSIFTAGGYTVKPHMEGLGSLDSWAEIYVEHLKALEPKVKEQYDKDPNK